MNSPLPQQTLQEEETINLREILDKYLFHWKWFLVGLFTSVFLAFTYLRYSVPVYESKASILIKDEKQGGFSSELSMLKDLGITSGSGNLQNEIEIFKSRTLLENVSKNLRLNFTLQLIGNKSRIIRGEIYDQSPLVVVPATSDSLFYETEAQYEIVLINKDTYRLEHDDLGTLGTFNFGAVVKTADGPLIINRTKQYNSKWFKRSLRLTIRPMNNTISTLKENISVESVNKDAMVQIGRAHV